MPDHGGQPKVSKSGSTATLSLQQSGLEALSNAKRFMSSIGCVATERFHCYSLEALMQRASRKASDSDGKALPIFWGGGWGERWCALDTSSISQPGGPAGVDRSCLEVLHE